MNNESAQRYRAMRDDFPHTPFGQHVVETYPELAKLDELTQALLAQAGGVDRG